MASPTSTNKNQGAIIIGAGISGLLLAQYLRKSNIPFSIFERDPDFNTRGAGWGLTLHWSLPALRSLLPPDLVARLPETYVDREAVERGEVSTFPFYDLSTGELKGQSPPAPESQRIRVSREKFRKLLATGIEIQWAKTYKSHHYHSISSRNDENCSKEKREKGQDDSEEIVGVTTCFEDGTFASGSLLVGCDGARSRVRRDLYLESGTEKKMHRIPVGVLGVKADYYTSEKIRILRRLDPFFFQGTSSENDTYVYFSNIDDKIVLDAPGNNRPKTSAPSQQRPKEEEQEEEEKGRYTCQIVVSWPLRPGFFGNEAITSCPKTKEKRLELIRAFAQTWAEPFRSLVLDIPPGTEIKPVDLQDWVPPPLMPQSPLQLSQPPGPRPHQAVTLMGDAFHPMAMYRGEGANHAIVDVLDFATIVFKSPSPDGHRDSESPGELERQQGLAARLKRYADKVIERTRPAVLASRRACMDAHNFGKINPGSPLLSRRAMKLEFEDESLGWDY